MAFSTGRASWATGNVSPKPSLFSFGAVRYPVMVKVASPRRWERRARILMGARLDASAEGTWDGGLGQNRAGHVHQDLGKAHMVLAPV